MAYNKITYNTEYNRTHYERLGLQLPPGTKAELKRAADAAGMSITQYILAAVKEYQAK